MLSSVSASTGRTTAWPALAGGPQFVAIDSNGNLTGKIEDGHTWPYEWNAENQLKRVLKDAVEVARFAYDPLGRRVEKVAAGGVTTSYAYDGEDILKQTAGGTTVRYVHGLGIDEPLATENGAGQLSYEHADGLGSELKQTDATGTVTFSRSYDAFGQLQSGATGAGYAFTGREWDPETGLYYYRARYYDPRVGRFQSEDPIGFQGGADFYAYVSNNPATFTDPSGLLGTPAPASPSPKPSPKPTPIPTKPGPVWPIFNLCDAGDRLLYYGEVPEGMNPHNPKQRTQWIQFQTQFESECTSSGKDRYAFCSKMNCYGALGGWCCCCERKKTACK